MRNCGPLRHPNNKNWSKLKRFRGHETLTSRLNIHANRAVSESRRVSYFKESLSSCLKLIGTMVILKTFDLENHQKV